MEALSALSNLSSGDNTVIPVKVGEVDHLHLFRDNSTVSVYHVFIGYVSTDHAYPVECRILSLVRINSSICFVTSRFSRNDTRPVTNFTISKKVRE